MFNLSVKPESLGVPSGNYCNVNLKALLKKKWSCFLMVDAISSWEESIFCHVNEPSLKRWGMQRCPQLTRVVLCEPCPNLQVGRCATGNENRIDEELPGRMRHDCWPASIRNSCYCDEVKKKKEIKLSGSHCESSYDNTVDLLRAASWCCPLTWTHLKAS